MTHQEFVEAYRQGQLQVQIDPALAGKYISHKLLLPVVITPIIGLGCAMVLWKFYWIGAGLVLLGFILHRFIKASATNFVLTRALQDERTYSEVTGFNIMTLRSKE